MGIWHKRRAAPVDPVKDWPKRADEDALPAMRLEDRLNPPLTTDQRLPQEAAAGDYDCDFGHLQ